MSLQFSPMILSYFISSIVALFLGYRTWQIRASRGAVVWSLAMFFSAIYSFGIGLEAIFTDPTMKFAMIPIFYLGITGLIFFWGLFCITYSQYQKWLNPFTLILLAFPPLITFIFALFVGHDHLIYQDYGFIEYNGLVVSQVIAYGSFFWFWVAYSYIVLIGGAAILIQSAIRSPDLYQGQIRVLVLSVSIPIIAVTLHLLGYNPAYPFDISPLALTVSGIFMLVAMQRYRFLDIVPVAHDVIFDNVVSAVLIIDLQERVINLNRSAEKIFQCSRNDVIGMPIDAAFPKYPRLQRYIQETLNSKAEIVLGKDTYELRISPLRNHRQNLVGHVIMLYNISERVQMERKELELAVERERVQVLQEFISNASHDLKTPLATMKTYHFLLRHELGDTANPRLDTLEAQTARLDELINDMLTMVRLEGHDELISYSVDINAVIQKVIDEYARPNIAHIQFLPERKELCIQSNEEEISLVISHLLSNAIRNTPPDGHITIVSRPQARKVQIVVRDTGVGISEGDLLRIFERFYRVDKARNAESGGSGLGLAIVKRIVERHQGQIEVSSTVGKGTEFCIELPLIEQATLRSDRTQATI